MRVVILAGGLGTRLRPVVGDRPKVMVQFEGRPFLEYLVDQLRSQGFVDLVLCVGHRARQIQDYFGDGRRHGVRIVYVVERDLLGTAGAIRNARHLLDSTFLVLNGDSYLEPKLADLVECHRRCRREDPDTIGSLAAVATVDAAGSGLLQLDQRGYLLSFDEKASAEAGWINAGAYALETAVLDLIPPGVNVSIERQTFPEVLARGKRLFGCRLSGGVIDIGTPLGYARFEEHVRKARTQCAPVQ